MKKIIILIVLIFACVYSHHLNKHVILNSRRKIDSYNTQYKSEKDFNLVLLAEFSKLSSRERIQDIAFSKLNMFYPKNNENIHTIMINADKTFRLIDYIVPSAEAITK